MRQCQKRDICTIYAIAMDNDEPSSLRRSNFWTRTTRRALVCSSSRSIPSSTAAVGSKNAYRRPTNHRESRSSCGRARYVLHPALPITRARQRRNGNKLTLMYAPPVDGRRGGAEGKEETTTTTKRRRRKEKETTVHPRACERFLSLSTPINSGSRARRGGVPRDGTSSPSLRKVMTNDDLARRSLRACVHSALGVRCRRMQVYSLVIVALADC